MKIASTTGAIALATLLLSGPINTAVANENPWYISPMLSFVKADGDRDADNDLGLHLGVGKQLNDAWNIEISGVGDTLDAETGSGEYKQRGLIADGLYFFDRGEDLSVFGLVGLGALRTQLPGDKETNVAANIGVGVMKPLGDHFSLRSDLRYRLDDDDRIAGEDRFGDWLLNIGLYVPFGGKSSPAPAEPAPAPAPVAVQVMDSDGDGIADDKDNCPNTAAGISVNASGCEMDSDMDGIVDSKDQCPSSAANAKVDAMGCEMDSDMDGIVDSKDSCPSTPANTKVDSIGCIPDTDMDGVADNMDNCPGTASGTQVDSKGCKLEETIVLKGVKFETGSDQLTADSETELNDIANTMKKYSTMVVEVSGHTDNRGAESFNQRLSGKRAQSVVDYLVNKGVAADRLKAKGYGSSNPIADNNTAAGRAENRRVELQILQR